MSEPHRVDLARWQQREDDELLYRDQTLLVERGLTVDEQQRCSEMWGEEARARWEAMQDAQEDEDAYFDD